MQVCIHGWKSAWNRIWRNAKRLYKMNIYIYVYIYIIHYPLTFCMLGGGGGGGGGGGVRHHQAEPTISWQICGDRSDRADDIQKTFLVWVLTDLRGSGWFVINTSRPRQNGRRYPDDIFKCIFLNENICVPINISLKSVPKGQIYNIPSLVQIMAWRRPGDKPLFEPMVVNLVTHVCVTRPQWVKRYWPENDLELL